LEKIIEQILTTLDDKKAENIETFDLSGKGYIVDTVVIATSLNTKHTNALVAILKDELEDGDIIRTQEDGDWSVIDMGNTIIHVMIHSQREIYNLEDFLENFKIVDEN